MAGEAITNRDYWESYYGHKRADTDEITRIGSAYDSYWSTCIDSTTRSVIEIGAYPGRYLAYIAHAFDLYPTALDFQTDLSLIERNLRSVGIDKYTLINEDFLTWEPAEKYDLVVSLGFIEHFINYKTVISKHCDLLAKGGRLFVMIPNKKYLRKWYGFIADRDNLKAHNLRVMSLDVFKQAAADNDMEIETLEYSGPFQYGLHGDKQGLLRILAFNSFRLVFKKMGLNSIVTKYPSRFWSSSIICVMKKK